MARKLSMSLFSPLKQNLADWTRRFDEAVSQLPLIGGWFRPKWGIIIVHGDGRYALLDEQGREHSLTPEAVSGLSRHKHLCLRLDRHLGQQRDIVLPRAARHDAAGAIRLSAGQYFPFAPQETVFAVQGAGQDAGNGQWVFKVGFARRARVQEALQGARALGLAPRAVDVLGEDPLAPVRIDLAREGPAGAGRSASRWFVTLSAVLLVLAVLASAWSSMVLAPAAAQLQAGSGKGALDQALLQKRAKAAAPSVLDVWRAATMALPDDAYAQYLLYEKGHLRLAGKASDAAALVKKVEAQPLFHDTAFAAASIKGADGKESFDLITSVRKGKAP